jgi:hypothetical protein
MIDNDISYSKIASSIIRNESDLEDFKELLKDGMFEMFKDIYL